MKLEEMEDKIIYGQNKVLLRKLIAVAKAAKVYVSMPPTEIQAAVAMQSYFEQKGLELSRALEDLEKE